MSSLFGEHSNRDLKYKLLQDLIAMADIKDSGSERWLRRKLVVDKRKLVAVPNKLLFVALIVVALVILLVLIAFWPTPLVRRWRMNSKKA